MTTIATQQPNRQSLRLLTPYLRPYKTMAIVAPLLMLLEVAMDLFQPRLMQNIVDVGLAQLDMAYVLRTSLVMVGVATIGMLGGAGNGILSTRLGQDYGYDLREALYRRIQSLSLANLDRLGTGELVTRLTNDVTQIQEILVMVLRMLVRTPLLMVGALAMLILTSPRLSIIMLLLGPLVTVGLLQIHRRAHKLFTAVQQAIDGVNTVTQENLASVRVVKAFVRQRHEINRFQRAIDTLMQRFIHAERTVMLFGPMLMIAMNVGIVSVIWFGGRMVINGSAHVGQLLASINYLMITLSSLMMVGMMLTRLSRSMASAERLAEVLSSVPAIVDSPTALQELPGEGRIRLIDVGFAYGDESGAPVLSGINLEVEPGQTLAILGATGSGKSTLVHLIPRYYDTSAGSVLVDGVDVREVSQQTLRRTVGVVMQDPVLFTGTIRDNLRYGRPEASDAEIERAARMAQAHDFILSFPDGYDTLIGQRGVNLSGGQKQRLAIARALVTEPSILILDDSTSSVDVATEARIREAIENEMAGVTRIIVAQRISSVLHADKIIVLEGARIVAQGTHDELMISSPVYREIYDSQLGNGVAIDG
ncbi:MAG: ABC transporter ATP-binding protein [Anaerolineae bacterium]|jgi:ATP-binding cassette subfamily B multidrug efflux pump